jgi:hypothetical protein
LPPPANSLRPATLSVVSALPPPCSDGVVSAPYVAGAPIRVSALLPTTAAASGLPHVAVGSDDKKLAVLAAAPPAAPGFALAAAHETTAPKRPSALVANLTVPAAAGGGSPATPVLVLADRAGEAFAFPIPAVASKRRFLLGHTATLISCADGVVLPSAPSGGSSAGGQPTQLLVTGDRDEAIRVSRFPLAWDVAAFCRGHTRFVTAVRSVPHGAAPGDEPDRPLTSGASSSSSSPSAAAAASGLPSPASSDSSASSAACTRAYGPRELLVSGGGDGTLRLWHLPTGTLLHTVHLQQAQTAQEAAAAAANAAATISNPFTGPRVNSGPPPSGAVRVVGGEFGCYGSAGPHADVDMNFTSGGGGEEGGGGEGGDDDGAAGGEGGEDAAEATEAPASSASSSAATAAAGPSGSGGRALVMPHAFTPRADRAHSTALHTAPPVIPAQLTAAPCAPGLLATILDGEPAVRLFRVTMDAQPSRLPPAAGQAVASGDGRLPQARLAQVGVIKLAEDASSTFKPLAVTFLAPSAADDGAAAAATPPVLLVGGFAQSGGAASGAYALRAFTLALAPAPSRQVEACVSAAELLLAGTGASCGDAAVDAAYGGVLRSAGAVHAAFAAAPAGSPLAGPPGGAASVHAHVASERLVEYDKAAADAVMAVRNLARRSGDGRAGEAAGAAAGAPAKAGDDDVVMDDDAAVSAAKRAKVEEEGGSA